MLSLDPWNESGFALLERCNTPEMTPHLGGHESPAQLGVVRTYSVVLSHSCGCASRLRSPFAQA